MSNTDPTPPHLPSKTLAPFQRNRALIVAQVVTILEGSLAVLTGALSVAASSGSLAGVALVGIGIVTVPVGGLLILGGVRVGSPSPRARWLLSLFHSLLLFGTLAGLLFAVKYSDFASASFLIAALVLESVVLYGLVFAAATDQAFATVAPNARLRALTRHRGRSLIAASVAVALELGLVLVFAVALAPAVYRGSSAANHGYLFIGQSGTYDYEMVEHCPGSALNTFDGESSLTDNKGTHVLGSPTGAGVFADGNYMVGYVGLTRGTWKVQLGFDTPGEPFTPPTFVPVNCPWDITFTAR